MYGKKMGNNTSKQNSKYDTRFAAASMPPPVFAQQQRQLQNDKRTMSPSMPPPPGPPPVNRLPVNVTDDRTAAPSMPPPNTAPPMRNQGSFVQAQNPRFQQQNFPVAPPPGQFNLPFAPSARTGLPSMMPPATVVSNANRPPPGTVLSSPNKEPPLKKSRKKSKLKNKNRKKGKKLGLINIPEATGNLRAGFKRMLSFTAQPEPSNFNNPKPVLTPVVPVLSPRAPARSGLQNLDQSSIMKPVPNFQKQIQEENLRMKPVPFTPAIGSQLPMMGLSPVSAMPTPFLQDGEQRRKRKKKKKKKLNKFSRRDFDAPSMDFPRQNNFQNPRNTPQEPPKVPPRKPSPAQMPRQNIEVPPGILRQPLKEPSLRQVIPPPASATRKRVRKTPKPTRGRNQVQEETTGSTFYGVATTPAAYDPETLATALRLQMRQIPTLPKKKKDDRFKSVKLQSKLRQQFGMNDPNTRAKPSPALPPRRKKRVRKTGKTVNNAALAPEALGYFGADQQMGSYQQAPPASFSYARFY